MDTTLRTSRICAEPRRICAADDPNWLNHRTKGISASEAAAACGISEWESPRELYHRKRGELPPIEENRAMRFGKFAEPFIADEFQSQTGLEIIERQPGLYCHPNAEYILATPDFRLDANMGLETKTMNERRAWDALGEEYTDQVPLDWNMQCQQQMLVMGWEEVYIGVLVGGADVRVYHILRHEGLIKSIMQRVLDLWTRIQTANPPEMTDHETNLSMVRQLYPKVEPGEAITLSQDAADAWRDYEGAAALKKNWEELADRHKAKVLLEMGNAETGILPDGRTLRRKLIRKKEYTVAATEYVTLSAVKSKGS